MEGVHTQLRKFEEYAYVLDFKSRGHSSTVRGRIGIIVTAIGEDRLTLLEILGLENSTFEVGERIYIGKEGRTKVQSVLGKIDYTKISDSAQSEIPGVVESIIIKNEKRFVDDLNNAQSLTPRSRALELIPGIGKTYMYVIIQQREKKPFESYDDIERRAGLKEPIMHFTKTFILVSPEISSRILFDICLIGSFNPVRFSMSEKLSNSFFSLS